MHQHGTDFAATPIWTCGFLIVPLVLTLTSAACPSVCFCCVAVPIPILIGILSPELSLKNKRAFPRLIFYMAHFSLLRHNSFLYGAIMKNVPYCDHAKTYTTK